MAQVKPTKLKEIPIPLRNTEQRVIDSIAKKAMNLTSPLSDSYVELMQTDNPREKSRLERHIAGLQNALNQWVMRLYEISDDDKAIVECYLSK